MRCFIILAFTQLYSFTHGNDTENTAWDQPGYSNKAPAHTFQTEKKSKEKKIYSFVDKSSNSKSGSLGFSWSMAFDLGFTLILVNNFGVYFSFFFLFVFEWISYSLFWLVFFLFYSVRCCSVLFCPSLPLFSFVYCIHFPPDPINIYYDFIFCQFISITTQFEMAEDIFSYQVLFSVSQIKSFVFVYISSATCHLYSQFGSCDRCERWCQHVMLLCHYFIQCENLYWLFKKTRIKHFTVKMIADMKMWSSFDLNKLWI